MPCRVVVPSAKLILLDTRDLMEKHHTFLRRRIVRIWMLWMCSGIYAYMRVCKLCTSMDVCNVVVCIFLVACSALVILPRIIGTHAFSFPHNNVFMVTEARPGSFICMRSRRGYYFFGSRLRR